MRLQKVSFFLSFFHFFSLFFSCSMFSSAFLHFRTRFQIYQRYDHGSGRGARSCVAHSGRQAKIHYIKKKKIIVLAGFASKLFNTRKGRALEGGKTRSKFAWQSSARSARHASSLVVSKSIRTVQRITPEHSTYTGSSDWFNGFAS